MDQAVCDPPHQAIRRPFWSFSYKEKIARKTSSPGESPGVVWPSHSGPYGPVGPRVIVAWQGHRRESYGPGPTSPRLASAAPRRARLRSIIIHPLSSLEVPGWKEIAVTDGRPGAGWLDRWSIGGHRTARSPPTTAANLIPVAGDFFSFSSSFLRAYLES